ncbi:hypothetical protein FKM82_007045 [Ascaphus truei]
MTLSGGGGGGSRAGSKKARVVPVVKLLVTDADIGEQEQVVPFKSMDLSRVLKLLEDPCSRDLMERHVRVLKKVAKHYCNGVPLKDLTHMFKMLNICAERIEDHADFVEPMCEILKLSGLPFLKEKTSDEISYAQVVAESISQLGCLMRVPSSQVRIQICNSIIHFYNPEPVKQQVEGFHPTSGNYKIQMAEVGGLAETMVLSLSLLENRLQEKLWLLRVLQLLSSTSENCKLMAKAQAASRICSRLNDPDPSGQLLFRSSEILWNLLENGPKEELINQLSNLECIYALKESFIKLLTNGYKHYDRQLRNDLLVIATLIAENHGPPMVESGFAKQLILFATFSEVKHHNPLVKSLKLLHSNEDFEMKKLLFNMIVVLSKDLSTIQLNLKSMNNLVLGILVEFCDNPKSISHIATWRGNKNETAAKLLIQLWKEEEEELCVRRDDYGRIIDAKKPLVGQFQEAQAVNPMPANCSSIAIMEVAENTRAKIYSVFSKLGFENLPGLSAMDYVTLSVISRYLDFKVGEVWSEIRAEIKAEGFKPVTSDQEALDVIAKSTENISTIVASHQTEMIDNYHQMELQEEQQKYAEIKTNHKQRELVMKSWDNFLARTSNYEALKKAKRLQEKSIESSRPKARPKNTTVHSTQIPLLNTTVACGRVVTVESTPSQLIGGPLADTDIALKRVSFRGGALQKVKTVKVLDQLNKHSVSCNK